MILLKYFIDAGLQVNTTYDDHTEHLEHQVGKLVNYPLNKLQMSNNFNKFCIVILLDMYYRRSQSSCLHIKLVLDH